MDMNSYEIGVAPSINSNSRVYRTPLPKWAVIVISVVSGLVGLFLLGLLTYCLYKRNEVKKAIVFYEDLIKQENTK